MGLQITIRESGDVTVLDLRGKSTLSPGGSESLSRCLRKLEADGVRRLLLNLTDLVQIDSSGITLIVKAYIHLRARGGDLRLLRPNGHVLEVLRLSGCLKSSTVITMKPRPSLGSSGVTPQNLKVQLVFPRLSARRANNSNGAGDRN